ncbi:hypothetical protein LTR66_009420 [Elasticomyces elasticus]|nr:hypothetical protein LTR66_009420 [Elasticomyces elasticus]
MNNESPSGNVLTAGPLSEYMAASLPKDASPQLKTPTDAVALAAHACMLAVGFRLKAIGDDQRIEPQPENSDTRPLPSAWNATSPHYSFKYAHAQSSMDYELVVSKIGNKAVVTGMGIGDDKRASFDITVHDFISPSSLPASPVTDSDGNLDQAKRNLINIYISVGRLSDLGSLMRLNIVQKLMPGLRKDGYQEDNAVATGAQRQPASGRAREEPRRDPLREDYQPPARPYPFQDPLAQPRRPLPDGGFQPPGFDDEYDMIRPPRPLHGGPGFGNIGERDLYPQGLGPNDPFRNIGPHGGLGGGGGGMHPTFDDPLFDGRGGRGGQGGGYDPHAPPGARYDPVGPGGAPRGSGRGGGFPGGGGFGGRPPNPFGGFGSGDFI